MLIIQTRDIEHLSYIATYRNNAEHINLNSSCVTYLYHVYTVLLYFVVFECVLI